MGHVPWGSATVKRRQLIGGGMAMFASPAWAAPGPWRTLLDGRSLAAWDLRGDANWRLEQGAAVADKGTMGFLVSKETFGDFELRTEFWVSPEANSGVFIRCTNPFTIGVASGYECNIYDTRPDPAYATGAIVNVAKVSPMPKAGGRWNVMLIRAVGDRFWIDFNGQRTVDGARDAAFSHGRVALQYGAGVVKFRKVAVRTL
jgi:hypothetical protein